MNKKKVTILTVVCLIFISIISISIYFVVKPSNSSNKENKETVVKKKKKKKEIKKEVYKSPIPNYQATYSNDEIIGELSIPSIDLIQPVAKNNDNNDFYLTHDLYKNDSKTGALLFDYRIDDIDTAKQINIYGHNSDYYVLPFKKLENYLIENFAKDNPIIYLNTNKKSYLYKIYAIKIFTTEDEHTIISYGNEDSFVNHTSIMRENATYDSGEVIDKNDRILILQTCLYNPVNTKLLVMAKLEKE